MREASGSEAVLRQLVREAVARKWIMGNGIPVWRNPASPEANPCAGIAGKRSGYSLLFSDGSRVMVCSQRDSWVSFDDVASAKCFGILAVKLGEGCSGGIVEGFIPIYQIKPGIRPIDFAKQGLEPCSTFIHYLKRPSSFFLVKLLFSARLLFAGEPDSPESGADSAGQNRSR